MPSPSLCIVSKEDHIQVSLLKLIYRKVLKNTNVYSSEHSQNSSLSSLTGYNQLLHT